MEWHAQFAYDQDVERRMEGMRDLGRNDDASSWKAKHDRLGRVQVRKPCSQSPSGFTPVSEAFDRSRHTSTLSGSARSHKGPRSSLARLAAAARGSWRVTTLWCPSPGSWVVEACSPLPAGPATPAERNLGVLSSVAPLDEVAHSCGIVRLLVVTCVTSEGSSPRTT